MPKTIKPRPATYKIYDLNINKDHIFNSPKQLLTCLIIVFLFLWLNKEIKDYFDFYIVEIILSKFPLNDFSYIEILLYVIILLATVKYTIYPKYKNSYKPSLTFYFLLSFIPIIYFYIRINDYYKMSRLFSHEAFSITIFDPIYSLIFLFGVVLLINTFKNSNNKTENNSYIFHDPPIRDKKEDEYKREKIAFQFSEMINNLIYNNKQSFAIGITGEWGYGKTSFLGLIQENLDKKFIKIEYNPWIASSKLNLIEDFFDKIDKEISKYIETKNLIRKYGSALTQIGTQYNASFLLTLFEKNKSLQDRFEEISILIQKTNRKVVIIIDDIDRLDNEEIFEVLRLVRNTASFPNTIFIVAYDKNYLIHAIKNRQIFNSQTYLEKIFQLEINLPNINKQRLTEIFSKTIISKLEVFTEEKADFILLKGQIEHLIHGKYSENEKYKIQHLIYGIIKNKRDINRFANSFLFYFLSIHNKNIYLPDLFILELIKYNNQDVYNWISSYRGFYKKTSSDISEIFSKLNANKENNDQQDELSQLLNELGVGENIEIIKPLVEKLFNDPIDSDYKSNLSIAYVENVELYFSLVLQESQVSSDYLEKLINNSNNTKQFVVEEINNAILDNKELSLLNRLEIKHQVTNIAQLKNYVLIFTTLLEKSDHARVHQEFVTIITSENSFMRILEEANGNLLDLIIDLAVYPYLGVSNSIYDFIINHTYYSSSSKFSKKDKLLELNIKFLEMHINSDKIEMAICIRLLYNCISEIDPDTRVIRLDKSALTIFKNFLLKDDNIFQNYLSYFLRPKYTSLNKNFPGLDIVVPEPFYKEIFGSSELFIKTLQTSEKSKLSKEIMNFMKKHLKGGTENDVTIDDFKPYKDLHKYL